MSKQENGAVSTKVVTGKVRLSFVNVFTPKAAMGGGEPKYSTTILIDKKDKKTLRAINAAIEAAYEAGKGKLGNRPLSKIKTPLRDGEEREEYDGFAGCMFINASSSQKPGIVDRNRVEILDKQEIYSGMYARVSINFFAYDTAGNRGIGAGLNNIQKIADGPFLGGRMRAEDEFDDWDEDEDDEDDPLA